VGSFDPTNAATYTFNLTALQLPYNEQAVCLAELGTNLMVGGSSNRIFPWDRVSTSFAYPIFVAENFISQMVTANTTMYIFAGSRGNIYQTHGSNCSLLIKFPDQLADLSLNATKSLPTYWFRSAIYHRNKLYFSIYVLSNGQGSSTPDGSAISGIWCYDLDLKNLTRPYTFSFGTANTQEGYARQIIPLQPVVNLINDQAVYSLAGQAFAAAWKRMDGSSSLTYGVDGFYVSSSSSTPAATPYAAGESFVDTEFIRAGTFLSQRTFENIEFLLYQGLVSGESVAISYRTSYSGTFTTVGTTTSVGAIADVYPLNFEGIQIVQFRIVTTSITQGSYVRLKEIRLR
jgi:hypothetical protein